MESRKVEFMNLFAGKDGEADMDLWIQRGRKE